MVTQAELQERIAEFEATQARTEVLNQISRGLNAAGSEKELLHTLAQPAVEAGAFRANLMYIDLDEAGEPEWVEIVATWQRTGTSPPPVPVGTRFYLSEMPFSHLWLSSPDEPQLVADVATDERLDENTRNVVIQVGTRAMSVIPLTQAGRWVGILTLDWDEPHEFSPQEAAIYRAFRDLASPVVENQRLLDRTQRALTESEMLYEISRGLNEASDEDELLQVLARTAMEAGAVSTNLIYIDLDEIGVPEWAEIVATWQQENALSIPPGTRYYLPEMPFAQLWMANPDEPQLVADVTTDEGVDENTRNAMLQGGSRAVAVIPMSQAGRWVGLLTLSWAEPHEFGEQEVEVYRRLIGLATPAVASRRLLVEKERALTETLYRISRDLNTANDEDEILRVLAQPAQEAGAIVATLMSVDLNETGEPEWLEIIAHWQHDRSLEVQMAEGPSPAPVGAPTPVGTRYYLPETLFAQLWMANPDEPLLVADVAKDERVDENFRGLLAQTGIRATATIPLTQAGLREPLPLPKPLPLLKRSVGRRWVGLVTFSWAEPHEFSPQEVEIYEALIGLASPSVENRHLFEQTRARAERERFVRTAVDRIRQGTDTEAIMRITLQELGQMLGASKSIVRLGTQEQLCPESVEG